MARSRSRSSLRVTLFGVLVVWYSVGLVGKNHDLEATSLPLSMAWMYAPMVLAGLVTAVQGAREVVEVAAPATGRRPARGATDR